MEIKEYLNKLNEILGEASLSIEGYFISKGEFKRVDCNSNIEIKDPEAFLTSIHNNQMPRGSTVRLRRSLDEYACCTLVESHNCCAKLYMYGIECYGLELSKMLLQICELVARLRNYTYIGYIHKANDVSIKAGEEVGFRKILTYTNKRTMNKLCEMYKILE